MIVIYMSSPCFIDPRLTKPGEKKKKKRVLVPLRILETAVLQCERFLSEREHEDIDRQEEVMRLTHCMLLIVFPRIHQLLTCSV